MLELTWTNFILAFIPLFVAMDAAGAVPFYISLTSTLDHRAKRRVIVQSLMTAGALGIVFLFIGNRLLHFLGITLEDFKIAGGIVLLVLAVLDLIKSS
ncbi:MarC family protein [Candidatus Acetothermia bacterium]|nr:MarC family protein [Candidatus Acetothermia bacterium]